MFWLPESSLLNVSLCGTRTHYISLCLNFVVKTEMKKNCQMMMASVLCQLLCSIGYVHNPALKLLAICVTIEVNSLKETC